jgi:hypothetical protein
MTEQALRDTMVMLGASLFQRGYATGGAGNLSALLPDGTLIATPTGSCLGRLSADRLSHVNLQGEHLGGDRLQGGGLPPRHLPQQSGLPGRGAPALHPPDRPLLSGGAGSGQRHPPLHPLLRDAGRPVAAHPLLQPGMPASPRSWGAAPPKATPSCWPTTAPW